MKSWKRMFQERTMARDYYAWKLDRPKKPTLPSSYFWTWDHSCN